MYSLQQIVYHILHNISEYQKNAEGRSDRILQKQSNWSQENTA